MQSNDLRDSKQRNEEKTVNLPENIKRAASWNNVSPVVLDNLVHDFSSYTVDDITVNYKGSEMLISQLYDAAGAEADEQIEQEIFAFILDDNKTVDFAVSVINNLPEGHDSRQQVAIAMRDVVNKIERDDRTYRAVKRAHASCRWTVDVEVSDDNIVSVNVATS